MPKRRILTIHPLAQPVDPVAVHREDDRMAGIHSGGAEAWYRARLAVGLAAGDLWARLDAAGARYELGTGTEGEVTTYTADVYLPAGCDDLRAAVVAWAAEMGAEVRDAG